MRSVLSTQIYESDRNEFGLIVLAIISLTIPVFLSGRATSTAHDLPGEVTGI